MQYGWIWIGVIALAIVIEVLTDQLVSIWFVPGAIVATILDFCKVGIIWQVLVFLIVSAIGILVGRVLLGKISPKENIRTNIEAIIGERCVVTEKIDNFAGCGQVKIKGQIWSARGVDEDDIYDEGEILRVVAIEGVKVICKK